MISLDELKNNYISQLNAEFKELFTKGYATTLNNQITSCLFDCDRESVSNLKYLLEFSEQQNLTTVTIRLFDNSFIPMTVVQLGQLCLELTSYGLAAYQIKWNKEQEIFSCTTEESLLTTTENFFTL